MSVTELIKLRDAVLDALPFRTLAQMNLEQEVLLLFLQTRELMTAVMSDSEVPANQKAQVCNSCANNLNQLVKMQVELYKSERVKALEMALTRTLKTLPEEQQLMFLDEYEKTYDALQESLPKDVEAA